MPGLLNPLPAQFAKQSCHPHCIPALHGQPGQPIVSPRNVWSAGGHMEERRNFDEATPATMVKQSCLRGKLEYAMARNSVLLPTPFLPTMPYLVP
eukprot:749795-Hanusia_phi.AAC.12